MSTSDGESGRVEVGDVDVVGLRVYDGECDADEKSESDTVREDESEATPDEVEVQLLIVKLRVSEASSICELVSDMEIEKVRVSNDSEGVDEREIENPGDEDGENDTEGVRD